MLVSSEKESVKHTAGHMTLCRHACMTSMAPAATFPPLPISTRLVANLTVRWQCDVLRPAMSWGPLQGDSVLRLPAAKLRRAAHNRQVLAWACDKLRHDEAHCATKAGGQRGLLLLLLLLLLYPAP